MSAASAHAADLQQMKLSLHFTNQAKSRLQNEHYVEAAHYFTKALDLDRNNDEARLYLRRIQNGYYSHSGHDPRKELGNEQLIRSYRLKIDHLEQAMRERADKITALKTDLAQKENDLSQQETRLAKLDTSLHDLQSRYEDARQHWNNERLALQRETLILEKFLARSYEQQQNLQAKIAFVSLQNHSLNQNLALLERQSHIETTLSRAVADRLAEIIHHKDHQISTLKTDYAQVAQDSRQTRHALKVKNHMIASLDSKISDLQSRLSTSHKTNQNLVSKNQTSPETRKMTSRLFLANQKIKNTQHTIRRQQKVILNLTAELSQLEKRIRIAKTDNREKDAADKLALKRLSKRYKGTLKLIKHRDREVARLKDQLVDTRRQLAKLETEMSGENVGTYLALRQKIRDILAKLEKEETAESLISEQYIFNEKTF
ncbi:MAG: hypothetical protein ACLFPX_02445 [Candidatus Omnitrophota bacterium]